MDFNPANPDHQQLMAYFENNPSWQDITESFKDEYIEETKND